MVEGATLRLNGGPFSRLRAAHWSLRHPTGKLCTLAQARAKRRGVSWAAACRELEHFHNWRR